MDKENLITKNYCLIKKYCCNLYWFVFIHLLYIVWTLHILHNNSKKYINNICFDSIIWELCLVTMIISTLSLISVLCIGHKRGMRKVSYMLLASLTVITMILIGIQIHKPCNYISLSSNLIFIIIKYWFYFMCCITLTVLFGSMLYIIYYTLIEFSYINNDIDNNVYYNPLDGHSVVNLI